MECSKRALLCVQSQTTLYSLLNWFSGNEGYVGFSLMEIWDAWEFISGNLCIRWTRGTWCHVRIKMSSVGDNVMVEWKTISAKIFIKGKGKVHLRKRKGWKVEQKWPFGCSFTRVFEAWKLMNRGKAPLMGLQHSRHLKYKSHLLCIFQVNTLEYWNFHLKYVRRARPEWYNIQNKVLYETLYLGVF